MHILHREMAAHEPQACPGVQVCLLSFLISEVYMIRVSCAGHKVQVFHEGGLGAADRLSNLSELPPSTTITSCGKGLRAETAFSVSAMHFSSFSACIAAVTVCFASSSIFIRLG